MSFSGFTRGLLTQQNVAGWLSRLGIFTTGNIFFVDSGHASASDSSGNSGDNPSSPFATVATAIGKCVADRGDVILVAHRHAETQSASGSVFTQSKTGTAIVGLRHGALVPTFTLTHASATATVSGANTRLHGLKFLSGVADCSIGLTVAATADGSDVDGCWFASGSLTTELQIAINVATLTDNVKIRGNYFETATSAESGSETHGIKLAGAADQAQITDNVMIGNFGTAAIDGATAASVRLLIARNLIHNIDSTNGLAISIHASTTGICSDNRALGLKTNTVPIVAAGMSHFFNLTTAAVNESGLLKPDAETFS